MRLTRRSKQQHRRKKTQIGEGHDPGSVNEHDSAGILAKKEVVNITFAILEPGGPAPIGSGLLISVTRLISNTKSRWGKEDASFGGQRKRK